MKYVNQTFLFFTLSISSILSATEYRTSFLEESSPTTPSSHHVEIPDPTQIVARATTAEQRITALRYATRIGLQTSVLVSSGLAVQKIADFNNAFENFDFVNFPCNILCVSDFSFVEAWEFIPPYSNLGTIVLSSTIVALHFSRLIGAETWQKTVKLCTLPVAIGIGFSAITAYTTLSEFDKTRSDGFPSVVTEALSDAVDTALLPAILGFCSSIFDGLMSYKEFKQAWNS